MQDEIYDAFVKLAVEKASSGQGNWEDQPIVDKLQFDKVMNYIEAGKPTRRPANLRLLRLFAMMMIMMITSQRVPVH